jgi:hypothetical protein
MKQILFHLIEYKGAECNYYHRIPTIEDEVKMDLTHDIFGRERHRFACKNLILLRSYQL